MSNTIIALVRCTGCEVDSLARIVLQEREGQPFRCIEPPRPWLYVWAATSSKEKDSVFACCRWCARDIMAEIVNTTNEKIVYSWCEQTQVRERYEVKDE
jgi:hypothetical protein